MKDLILSLIFVYDSHPYMGPSLDFVPFNFKTPLGYVTFIPRPLSEIIKQPK